MKKQVLRVFVALLSLTLMASVASAQSPSAKFTAQVSNVTLVAPTDAQDWKTVLTVSIKTPNKKDLLIGGSLETGLFTLTQVKGKLGTTDTAMASATLKVRLRIDDSAVTAFPSDVVYDKRAQTLSATLGGVIESCSDLNDDGTIDVATECVVTDEMIQLILDTMAAHHFNFVVANLTSGVHKVELQVKVDTAATHGSTGAAEAWASVGRGSLTVEEVRATNNPDGIEFLQ